jgi:hypothetical protein
VASDYTGNVADTLLGANRLIPAGTKHFSPVTSRSNKVQAGALNLVNSTSPLGSPSQANPVGRQTS